MEVRHPEWLQLNTNKEQIYGYKQEWYTTFFKRTRGCGPTVAAMLLVYLNRREAALLPYRDDSPAGVTNVLEDVWNFVTPGWLLGINSTDKFCAGIRKLLQHYGLNWHCRWLGVAGCRTRRVSLSRAIAFIEAGLAEDCPVAFLNLHKGRVIAFESWHWIVLLGLSYDEVRRRYLATAYDGGHKITFDLGLWLESSKWGGGFVYITVPVPAGSDTGSAAGYSSWSL